MVGTSWSLPVTQFQPTVRERPLSWIPLYGMRRLVMCQSTLPRYMYVWSMMRAVPTEGAVRSVPSDAHILHPRWTCGVLKTRHVPARSYAAPQPFTPSSLLFHFASATYWTRARSPEWGVDYIRQIGGVFPWKSWANSGWLGVVGVWRGWWTEEDQNLHQVTSFYVKLTQ